MTASRRYRAGTRLRRRTSRRAGYACWLLLGLASALAACGAAPPDRAALPTAKVRLVAVAPAKPRLPAATAAASPAPADAVAFSPATAAPPATPTPASDFEQYRSWMAEARAQHPYPESLDRMWDLMICESSGQPDIVAGENYGLFQYTPATWAGEWNPYRDQPILDPRAQIFATAKAWHDGGQGWWGCY